MTLSLKGAGISNGIAIGKIVALQTSELEISEYALPKHLIPDEINRFRNALEIAKQQLKEINQSIPDNAPSDISAFINTHLLMLDDSALSDVPEEIINERQCNAEWALNIQQKTLVDVFEEMDDPYLRTRKDDVIHVVNRVQRILLDLEKNPHEIPERKLRGRIILADDIAPSDAVLIMHQGIAGFVTEHGGTTSHTAILARSLGIPGIVGLKGARRYLEEDEIIIIDGENGDVVASPDEYTLKYYRKKQRDYKRFLTELKTLKNKPSRTKDRRNIKLHANIELPEDITAVKRVAAAGVGLYRTEFLFMNRDEHPSEEEQFQAYRKVVKSLNGAPLTIRTLDLGADKQVDGKGRSGTVTTNPALGLRAIRLCLREPAMFLPQLKAILRASAYGPVKIMIPMLSNLNELSQVMQLIDEAKHELQQRKQKFDNKIAVGGMIEIPAAAISAHIFAEKLDFLSIGTNDLIQYTLAIDRIDDDVNYLYDPVHPAVLKLIQMTIDAGNNANIPVAMCGEMAGDVRYTRLLLGMGLKEFSMHPASLLNVKKIIKESDTKILAPLARKILRNGNRSTIVELIEKMNKQNM
ncbi:MAG: phosphoenolpyruvate--protein phosphotransferase [Gammaproteobacteria bacterium]|nr:phosphoenolpyruvate--protein phosphotransferase [Gammaproteobacteria bacterium]